MSLCANATQPYGLIRSLDVYGQQQKIIFGQFLTFITATLGPVRKNFTVAIISVS
jgi:hypothetical protein